MQSKKKQPTPKPSAQDNVRLVVTISKFQRNELHRRADALGLTVSNMVRRALTLPEEEHGRRKDLEDNS